MDTQVDQSSTWQQQQQQQQHAHQHSQRAGFFPNQPPPGPLGNLNALPYPLTSGTPTFDPTVSSPSSYGFAHRRHNSLGTSTSSTDSGFSDLSQNDHTFQPHASARSDDGADASFNTSANTATTLRHSRGNVGGTGGSTGSMGEFHPSGLTAPSNLLLQELHADGRPRRPMNAFMIYARHRRPEFQKNEPGLKTGDLSKRLSAEWKGLDPVKKSFYLEQAKILKDAFHEKFPTYVYRRRPNNQGRRSRNSRSARGSSGSGRGSSTDSSDSLGSGHSPGDASPSFISTVTGEFPSSSQYMAAPVYRLGSSLGSSQSSLNGAGARAYDGSPMLPMSVPPRGHGGPTDFDQGGWPATPPQPYSPATAASSTGLYSQYSPYAPPPSSRTWDPNFAATYDRQGSMLSRSWAPGYTNPQDGYMSQDQRSQTMAYPSVSYAAPSSHLAQSTDHWSGTDYGRYSRSSYMPGSASTDITGNEGSASAEVSGAGRDTQWGGLPPTPQLPPPMLRQESAWSTLPAPNQQQPPRTGFGGGSGHSSSSESVNNLSSQPGKYYGGQSLGSVLGQPLDTQISNESPSQALPGDQDSQAPSSSQK